MPYRRWSRTAVVVVPICDDPAVTLPRIFVTVPGVEDLHTVVVLLRSAGAEITHQRREFVIEGPLTPERATAVWVLAQHRDGNSAGNQFTLRIEPSGDLEAALMIMCPQGFERISGDWLDPDSRYEEWMARQRHTDSSIHWWQQQQRQSELRKAAAVTVPAPAEPPVCCGEGGTWAPAAGAPVVLGCMLCPKSTTTYWRTHRADGTPYEPVKPPDG